jgi:hypothetical protein
VHENTILGCGVDVVIIIYIWYYITFLVVFYKLNIYNFFVPYAELDGSTDDVKRQQKE